LPISLGVLGRVVLVIGPVLVPGIPLHYFSSAPLANDVLGELVDGPILFECHLVAQNPALCDFDGYLLVVYEEPCVLPAILEPGPCTARLLDTNSAAPILELVAVVVSI